MDSTITGEFRLEKIDGKQYFVFHLNKNSDEDPMNSGDTDNNYLSESTMFLCPSTRIDIVFKKYPEPTWDDMTSVEMDCSPGKYLSKDKYEKERLDYSTDHYVLPLFWCKNKDNHRKYRDEQFASFVCQGDYNDGSDYYFCEKCEWKYHKECVESPLEIKHPAHPNHPLKLFYLKEFDNCVRCNKKKKTLIYHCTQCNLSIDPVCAQKSLPLVIEQPKRHDHPLKFFTRKTSLDCNVCGLVRQMCSTYICVDCDFVAHQDCYDSPTVIRISRHKHRISFTSSLPPGKWSCGVCRKKVDNEYGAYTCKKCDGYYVHSRCALRKDIWDGKELEGVPEEDEIEEVVDPFERIGDGLIFHFLHKHDLKLETSGEIYDESKICDACVVPIYEGDFYKCKECDFILHDRCANAPRKIRHPLHPHPLTLRITGEYDKNKGYFRCNACYQDSSGFIYECNEKKNCFSLDLQCSFISEPFDYQGHEHPLFLALDPQERHFCHVCQSGNNILINCIECDFIICLECVSLPYMVRYKHDKHFLTLEHWKETDDPDWCEICEKLLSKHFFGKDKRFYRCRQCCTTLHTYCLLGRPQYFKPGHTICGDIQIVLNNSLSRPNCFKCGNRCLNKLIYKTPNYTACWLLHVDHFDPFL